MTKQNETTAGSDPKSDVNHLISASRFELRQDGLVAVLQYTLQGDTIIFTHTEVPAEMEGRGIGSQLARAGLGYAAEKDLRVVSLCWFVSGYIERHPEYEKLLKG